MLGIETRPIGWAMTTSWLDESVANFGLAGIFIGPLILGIICRIGHAAKEPVVDATTTLIAILFLTVQLAAFYPLAALWMWQRVRPGRGRKARCSHTTSGFLTSIAVRGGSMKKRPAPALIRNGRLAAASVAGAGSIDESARHLRTPLLPRCRWTRVD